MAAFTEHECTDPNEVKEAAVTDSKDCKVEENLNHKKDAVDPLIRVPIKCKAPQKPASIKDGRG